MSAPAAVDFLNELNEVDSITALQKACSQDSVIVFKLAEYPIAVQTVIDSFIDKRAMLGREVSELKFDMDQVVSIKFNIGTEVFFVKTKLKRHLNKVYFDMFSKVIQLKRRKEPRLVVPKRWAQTANILSAANPAEVLKCHVHDISQSGIRFELLDNSVIFSREDVIKIQFKIYKRAEVVTDAIVRFCLNRTNQNALLGMEFYNLKDIQQERIASIVSDIVHYEATAKF